MIAAGTEARFIRAILEPVCPVPFVAWPTHGLPGWVGALDLVVVMASDGAPAGLVATVHEAVRRGAQLLIACPRGLDRSPSMPASRSTDAAADRDRRPARGRHRRAGRRCTRCSSGPEVRPDLVADAMDQVAEDCSPFADVAANPAKDLAHRAWPTRSRCVWGGSVLAARASRRVAEALRAASGRAALAADADELLPIIESTAPRDPFADPFEDGASADRRPCLVLLDDGNTDDARSLGAEPAAWPPPNATTYGSAVIAAPPRLRRRALRRPAADRDVRRGLPRRRARTLSGHLARSVASSWLRLKG